MVDVDRRMAGLSPAAHAAGLRRLSARAATTSAAPPSPTSSASHRGGLLSFRPLAESVATRLAAASVSLLPPLSDAEMARLEADLGFTFPPDLRALLSVALPSSPGFPDWRSHLNVRSSSSDLDDHPKLLRLAFDLPLAAASLQVVRGSLWPRSWGPRPADPDRALRFARSALHRAPVLIPLFERCYIPASPCLAGNPVFFVDDSQIHCCGVDLADFFLRHSAFQPPPPTPPLRRHKHQKPPLPPSTPSTQRSVDTAVASRTPRWIEFWSDAASDRRRRISSSSSSSSSSSFSETASSPSSPTPDPARFVEIRSTSRMPHWVDGFLDRIGSVLREGGWGEMDVNEMVHVSASGIFDGPDDDSAAPASPGTAVLLNADAVLDALLVRADRCSDSLRRAGWSSDDVSDALLMDLGRRRRGDRRPPVKLPPHIALKFEKLAESVAKS